MIIMMFRTNAYKEMILPNLDNTDYRIFVDKKLFDVYHSLYLKLEIINRKWRINADEKAYSLIHHKQTCDFVELSGCRREGVQPYPPQADAGFCRA